MYRWAQIQSVRETRWKWWIWVLPLSIPHFGPLVDFLIACAKPERNANIVPCFLPSKQRYMFSNEVNWLSLGLWDYLTLGMLGDSQSERGSKKLLLPLIKLSDLLNNDLSDVNYCPGSLVWLCSLVRGQALLSRSPLIAALTDLGPGQTSVICAFT